MEGEYSSIWDWLIESGQIKAKPDEPPKKTAVAEKPTIKPFHSIDDETLLALEREAEVAAKMRVGF
jgi:hypothetical protein